MLLAIKNMVCDRCILVVRQELEKLGFTIQHIVLGTVQLTPEPDRPSIEKISRVLHALGFELLSSEKEQQVEQIKTQVIAMVHHSDLSNVRLSLISFVAEKMDKDVVYLSRLFSDAEGITIEKFIIQQKIEKVKELLEYGELNLNEIAYRMGYSSSAHLSTQFKAVTGMPPSKYKVKPTGNRKPLDQVI